MAKWEFAFYRTDAPTDIFDVGQFTGNELIADLGTIHGSGSQAVYFGYHFDISLLHPAVEIADFIDQEATLEIKKNGHTVRFINGIITQMSTGHCKPSAPETSSNPPNNGDHPSINAEHSRRAVLTNTGNNLDQKGQQRYQVTLVPAVMRLSLRHNQRLFQLLSSQQIVEQILLEIGLTNYRFELQQPAPTREYCMQYQETDLAFIHRLSAQEGWIYYFEHQQLQHTLVFTDRCQFLPIHSDALLYHPNAGTETEQCYIYQFNEHKSISSSQVRMKDYNYLHPENPLETSASISAGKYSYFLSPGQYKDSRRGQNYSQLKLEQLRRNAHHATGSSNHAHLYAGLRFEIDLLKDCSELIAQPSCRRWYITEINHQGSQNISPSGSPGDGTNLYTNTFNAIPGQSYWRARTAHKPIIEGVMLAKVTGPTGEVVYSDQYGRIKIHFHWDLQQPQDNHASCWVRVAQNWAGAQYGGFQLPRVGHEVIVAFVNGDPDQPLVIGSAYNGLNTPPLQLPMQQTKTVVFRSQAIGPLKDKQAYSELSIEDQSEQAEVYLRAYKNLRLDINADQITLINQNQHTQVQQDQYTNIGGHQHICVDGESRTHVTEDICYQTEQSFYQKAGKIYAVAAQDEIHLHTQQKLVLEAASELSLKVGGHAITIDASGIHIVSPEVTFSASHRCAQGSGYQGQAPVRSQYNTSAFTTNTSASSSWQARPDSPTGMSIPPLNGQPLTRVNLEQQKRTLLQAAQAGQALCQTCTSPLPAATKAEPVANMQVAPLVQRPIVNRSADRIKSIIDDTPAIFEINANPQADGSKPMIEIAWFDEVHQQQAIYDQIAVQVDIDANLLKAIAYMETTHGYYDYAGILPGIQNSSFRPMNIFYTIWKRLVDQLHYSYTQIQQDTTANVHTGAVILKRIQTRIEQPTVEKIASIYNFAGAEVVSDYGARVASIHQQQLWNAPS